MALHPHVQKRAQIAIDRIVAEEHRLPTFEDQEKLPYVTAIVLEGLRWSPVAPFSIYHVAGKEGEPYCGYRIPKDAIIIPNLWAVLRDERLFGKDPAKFMPERFMMSVGEGEEEQLKADVTSADMAFGFGRRICPGKRELLWK